MLVRVLGSAAGGGFPQWNCACDNCNGVRKGDARFVARTQDSLAIESAGRSLLVNASPDVLRQLEATPALAPRAARDTPIAAIVLTNGDLDHVLGLFSLRESQRLVVYATMRVWRGLVEKNAIMRTLQRFEGQVTHRPLALGARHVVPELGDFAFTPFASPGKLPVHLMGSGESHAEDNVGLRFESGGRSVTYATSVKDAGAIAFELAADVVLMDGTFFTSDELVSRNLGTSRAEDMAHHPIGGERGSIAALESLGGRKIFTHINNTNPILRDGSEERTWVTAKGWEIARDGMEISP